MTVYDLLVPEFADAERVQFTATVNSILTDFIAEWWDDLWHLTITRDAEKRSCTLYPNTIHFPGDVKWRISPIFEGETIGLNDLSGMTIQLAVND